MWREWPRDEQQLPPLSGLCLSPVLLPDLCWDLHLELTTKCCPLGLPPCIRGKGLEGELGGTNASWSSQPILILPKLTILVTLDELFSLPEPLFTHLESKKSSTYLKGLFGVRTRL